MILQSLHRLYARLADDSSYGIAPPGFSWQKIGFRVVIRPDGSLFDIEDARSPDETGKLHATPTIVPGDAKPPGAGINPCLLWDNQTYLLGRQPEDKKDGFGSNRFEAFKRRHLELETSLSSTRFSLVCRFLESWSPELLADHPKLEDVGTGFGVFQIQGEKHHVHEDPEITQWWRENRPPEDAGEAAQCLISGDWEPIARLHPKIKGVTGAQSAGASIVSFNDNAYESYAKDHGENSPVGVTAASEYGAALNSLLTGPKSGKHRLRVGDTTAVFWTEEPTLVEDCFAELLGTGSNAPEEVQDPEQRDRIERLLRAVRSGGRFQELDDTPPETPFHILGLAPNAARLSVRFYHRSSVADLLAKLHDHQQNLEIVREFTEARGKRLPDAEFPPFWQILGQTARAADEIPPLLGGALARSILDGSNYPEALYNAVIRRIRADRRVNYLRAAILKAVLIRNHQQHIPTMLDSENTDPAYRLGRLFSALEKTQEDAQPGINATIRERFYSAASATPAGVFPRLLRTYQHHLAKLSGGAKVNREKLIQEILAPVERFPTQLNLKKQGLFAIGYYHQRKNFFTAKEQPEPETTETNA